MDSACHSNVAKFSRRWRLRLRLTGPGPGKRAATGEEEKVELYFLANQSDQS